jgi:hypothetical protein
VRRRRRSHTPQANDVLPAAGISPEHDFQSRLPSALGGIG